MKAVQAYEDDADERQRAADDAAAVAAAAAEQSRVDALVAECDNLLATPAADRVLAAAALSTPHHDAHDHVTRVIITPATPPHVPPPREWSLPNAAWTRKGTIDKRADTPQWLLNVRQVSVMCDV